MERLLLLVAAFLAGGVWGAAAISWKLFPYAQVKAMEPGLLGIPDPTRLGGYRERQGIFTAFGTPADIVMAGDSLTSIAEWAEMLPGYRVVNRGIAGDALPGMMLRASTIRQSGSHVFLMTGINDIIRERPITEIIAEHGALCDALAATGALSVQSVLPVAADYRGTLLPATVNGRVAQLNEAIKAQASAHGYRYLDLVPALSEPGQPGVLAAAYSSDGLHINAAGYRRWLDALKPNLPPAR